MMFGRLVIRSLRSAGCTQRLAGLSSVAETNVSEVEQVPSFGYEIPMIHSRKLEFPCNDGRSRKAWVENVDTISEKKLGMIDLHPDIFATPPRIDMIWCNIRWQIMYRRVNHAQVNTRAEMRGGGRKPWQQKGLGKARQGSIRAPQWINGGKAHGPRAPKTDFYMLPIHQRLFGLRSMLSIKLAQDDLHIVNAFDFPTNEPKYIEEMVEERLWGPSVLFVDDTDVAPENIALALENIPHMNLMPVYGLNVYSMVKHDTLVLTLAAVEKIEKQILFFMHRTDRAKLAERFKTNQV